MLITLGLILLILIMVVGGDRGVVSLIALCGNLLILSLAIWLMASGVPVLRYGLCRRCHFLYYVVLSKW